MMPVHSPREVRLLFGITILIRSITIIVQTIAPIIFVTIFDLSSVVVGWLIAGFWIANAFGTVFSIGVIRNRRVSTIVGLVIISTAFVGLIFLGQFVTDTIFIISEGVGLSMVQTFLVPSMYFNRKQGRPHSGLGGYSTALAIGGTVGPLIAFAAILFYDFSILFAILASISIGVLLFALRIGFQKSFGREDTSKSISSSKILLIIRQRIFASYYFLNFLYSMLLPILLSYAGIYSNIRFGIGTAEVMILFAAVFTLSVVMRVIFTNLRIKDFRVLLVPSFAILLVSFVLIGIANAFALFLLGFLLFSVPHAFIYPSTLFKALQANSDESVISSTYVYTTSSGVAEFISPLLALPIIALYDFSAIFLIMSTLAFIGLVFSLILPLITKTSTTPASIGNGQVQN